MRLLKVFVPVLVIAALAACAKPPTAEVDAAKAAVQSAEQSSDVKSYAPDQLKATQDKLAQLQSELDLQAAKGALQRNYTQAKNLALETKAAADTLATEAETAKEKAKSDAGAAIDELNKTLLPQAEQGLAMARKVRGVKLDFKALTASLNQAKSEVTAAQTAYNNGDYSTALSTADTVKGGLAQASQTVADAIAAAQKAK